MNNILSISWKKLNSKTDIPFRSKGGDFAAKINEEVLIGLIKRGYEIEENDSQIVFKLFIAEEDIERRKILYEVIRDSEYHKSLLAGWIRALKGEVPPVTQIKDYKFEEMFIDQKLDALRRVEGMALDFYRYLLGDLKRADLEKFMEKDKADQLLSAIEELIQEEKRHVQVVEKLREVR